MPILDVVAEPDTSMVSQPEFERRTPTTHIATCTQRLGSTQATLRGRGRVWLVCARVCLPRRAVSGERERARDRRQRRRFRRGGGSFSRSTVLTWHGTPLPQWIYLPRTRCFCWDWAGHTCVREVSLGGDDPNDAGHGRLHGGSFRHGWCRASARFGAGAGGVRAEQMSPRVSRRLMRHQAGALEASERCAVCCSKN